MHASPSKRRTVFPSRDSLTYVPRPPAIRRCSCTAIRATQGKTQIVPTFSGCSRISRQTKSASSMSIGRGFSLDRFSRSIADFGQLWNVLRAHSVEFVSVTEEWAKTISKCKEYINAGDIFQVVPSRQFRTRLTKPAFHFYRRLRQVNPSPYMFYLLY